MRLFNQSPRPHKQKEDLLLWSSCGRSRTNVGAAVTHSRMRLLLPALLCVLCIAVTGTTAATVATAGNFPSHVLSKRDSADVLHNRHHNTSNNSTSNNNISNNNTSNNIINNNDSSHENQHTAPSTTTSSPTSVLPKTMAYSPSPRMNTTISSHHGDKEHHDKDHHDDDEHVDDDDDPMDVGTDYDLVLDLDEQEDFNRLLNLLSRSGPAKHEDEEHGEPGKTSTYLDRHDETAHREVLESESSRASHHHYNTDPAEKPRPHSSDPDKDGSHFDDIEQQKIDAEQRKLEKLYFNEIEGESSSEEENGPRNGRLHSSSGNTATASILALMFSSFFALKMKEH